MTLKIHRSKARPFHRFIDAGVNKMGWHNRRIGCVVVFLLLMVFAAPKTRAQLLAPDHFFNTGAQFYISNNIPAALKQTESGLKLYPDDEKLQKLEKLLKQQQQSQSKQNQKKQQNQKNQSQKNQSQNKNQSQQKNSQQQKNQANQQKQNQQQQSAQKKSDAEKKEQEAKEKKGQGMTPKEAKRLLDAQKGDEQFLSQKPKEKPQDNQQPIKDW